MFLKALKENKEFFSGKFLGKLFFGKLKLLTHSLHFRVHAINAMAMLALKFSRSADLESGLSQLLYAVAALWFLHENRNI